MDPFLPLVLGAAAALGSYGWREAQLRAAMRRFPDGVAIFRAVYRQERLVDFCWVAVNPAAERLMGRSSASLRGKRQSQEYPTAYRELFSWYRDVRISGRGSSREIHYQGEGLDLWLHLTVAPLGRRRLLVTFRDIRSLKLLANYDSLTGLLSARALRDLEADTKVQALLYLSLDRFKLINSVAGRELGDQVLVEIARRLRLTTDRADLVIREGGDEFVIVPARQAGAELLAWRLVRAIELPVEVEGRAFSLSASIGVALQTGDTPLKTLRAQAELLVSRRKRLRNLPQVLNATPLTLEISQRRLNLEAELAGAARRGELVLFFQPIVDLQQPGYPLAGFEALIRWQHPSLGQIPPAEFIPIAEHSGLIALISDWVAAAAQIQAQLWLRSGRAWKLNINCSALDLARPDYLDRIQHLAQTLPPESVTLELTETAFSGGPETLTPMIGAIRELGVLTAIDDFGAGYNNLINLIKLPTDAIKIDREFVSGEHASPAICEGIVALARHSAQIVVAEGIETKEQAVYLAQLGCRYGQGWLFGRPLPAEEALALVER